MLDRNSAKTPAVSDAVGAAWAPAIARAGRNNRLDVHEAQPEGRARDEQVLGTDDAVVGDLGRTSAPGARLAP